MPAEKNLSRLLQNMSPTLHEGAYVFCSFDEERAEGLFKEAIMVFREEEGLTLILKQAAADQVGASYDFVAAWITLRVHSDLAAVGLTAAFSDALARAGISCNTVAGYYHDHIFVDQADAAQALEVLRALSQSA